MAVNNKCVAFDNPDTQMREVYMGGRLIMNAYRDEIPLLGGVYGRQVSWYLYTQGPWRDNIFWPPKERFRDALPPEYQKQAIPSSEVDIPADSPPMHA
ncbi:hypothetical protein [Zymobacter sp. IVIA_12111.31 C1]|uniref:hypothetical protein n=1 Tax=Zymobacter sp. IVIA_12111.31 C1 TaxID=3394854 RepID=UPI0039C3DDB6